MKEDVLEQVVDDYLQHLGYLTTHNIRFRPDPAHPDYVTSADAVHSDIDVVGLNPRRRGPDRVLAVSCKSWQAGFNPREKLLQMRGELRNPKRETWKHFRELWVPRWSEAFQAEVGQRTGTTSFTYVLAVTKLIGQWDLAEAEDEWNSDETISGNLGDNRVKFLELQTMWEDVLHSVTQTTAASEVGRLAQLLKAARLTG